MTKPARLDAELVRRGLAGSRSEAKQAIEQGVVLVGGLPATRVSTLVASDVAITLAGPVRRFVSRGGDKLDAALERLDVTVEGLRWLDAGASTGGFTDCLLRRGAAAVVAVDVGYGQFDWGLRNDPRVVVLERTNVRDLRAEDLPWLADGVAADLSFISLSLVLGALVEAAGEEADFVLLVKPQFEAGRDAVSRGGVVRDPGSWRGALERVARRGAELGLGTLAVVPSPLPGPAGNREFFLHLRRGDFAWEEPVRNAIEEVS